MPEQLTSMGIRPAGASQLCSNAPAAISMVSYPRRILAGVYLSVLIFLLECHSVGLAAHCRHQALQLPLNVLRQSSLSDCAALCLQTHCPIKMAEAIRNVFTVIVEL